MLPIGGLVKTIVSLLLLVPALAAADKSYVDGKGATWECAKDPDVSILANAGIYTLKGACKSISIDGNDNKVTVEGATKISVNGNQNIVDITTVDTLSANGNQNVVSIKKGSPKLSNNGTSNKINTAGSATTTTPTTPANTMTTVDCAKDPSYSITGGSGTYQFTGTCSKISVAGGSNHVMIENVKEIAVAGAKNVIAIVGVDKISNVGSDNKVAYKKGLSSEKPKISNIGTGSTVEQAK
jgi:hypothetical protein